MKKRLLLLIPVLAVALVAVVIGLGGRLSAKTAAVPSLPEKILYCGTCHSMEQEVTAWQKSPHSSVACMQCHTESDVAWVKHELTDLGDTMAGSSQVKSLHTIALQAPDSRCKDCHDSQMPQIMKDINPTPLKKGSGSGGSPGQPMAIKAAHAVHTEKAGLSCATCHTDSAHGVQLTGAQRRDQAHDTCQSCHAQKNVKIAVSGSTSCTACHVDAKSVLPSDHKDTAKWNKAHGKATQTQACGTCHLAESALPHSQISNPASFPSASKDSCVACHSGVQMPHPASFGATHGKVALATKPGTCESCHTADSKATTATGGAVSCASCHTQSMPHPAGFLSQHGKAAIAAPQTCAACHSPANSVNPTAAHASATYCTECHLGQTMPHPASFLATHGKDAQGNPATCEACHSSKNVANSRASHASGSYCTSCHNSYEHPAGWVANHGPKANDTSCGTCHTLTGQQGQHNACSACHTGTPGKDTWHPKMWFVSHARAVKQQGDEQCITCHAEVQPSCSACHRNR